MSLDPKKVAIEVEKALTSSGKLRILRLLMKSPDHAFTRYEIGKQIPLSPADIKNGLSVLVKIGWVKELILQHLQKYSINMDNELVIQFTDFFRKIRYV